MNCLRNTRYKLELFYGLILLIISQSQGTKRTIHSLSVFVNNIPQPYESTEKDCGSLRDIKSFPVNDVYYFHGENNSNHQFYLNCTWKQKSLVEPIYGFIIHLKGNEQEECNLIRFHRHLTHLEKENMFALYFLPTSLSDDVIVLITPLSSIIRKKREDSFSVSYNKNEGLIQIDLPDIEPYLSYNITIMKNPNEKCTEGDNFRFLEFSANGEPQYHVTIAQKPENGTFCIRILIPYSQPYYQQFNLTDEDEIFEPDCVYDGQITKWNLSIDMMMSPETKQIHLSFVPRCISPAVNFSVSLFHTILPLSNCQNHYLLLRIASNRVVNNNWPHLKTVFSNLSYGNYCVRVSPICGACPSDIRDLSRWSEVKELKEPLTAAPVMPPEIDDSPDNRIVVTASVVSIIAIIILVICGLLCYRRKRRPFIHSYAIDENIEEIIRKIEEGKKQRVLIACCFSNLMMRRLIGKLSELLESAFHCEIVIANSKTSKTGCSNSQYTSVNDWVANEIEKSDKILFIAPDRDIEKSLEARNDEESLFICCREIVLHNWKRKNATKIALIKFDDVNWFAILHRRLDDYTLPSHYGALYAFIHNIINRPIVETEFHQYIRHKDALTLENFISLLQNVQSTVSENANYNTPGSVV